MSEYEYGIKEKYEKAGYKFLFDAVGESIKRVNRKVAVQCGIPVEYLFGVQGECIDGSVGLSRWLMFDLRGKEVNHEEAL